MFRCAVPKAPTAFLTHRFQAAESQLKAMQHCVVSGVRQQAAAEQALAAAAKQKAALMTVRGTLRRWQSVKFGRAWRRWCGAVAAKRHEDQQAKAKAAAESTQMVRPHLSRALSILQLGVRRTM